MDAAAPLSVIICTHNPRADYFGRCLAALQAQTLPAAQWELVVVDNLSDEPLAERLDLGWHAGARLVREEKLGLTPARLRGIREAAGKVLVFVDDDNVLDPDYLATALRIAGERPFLGSWSGQCLPSFEQAPEAWTERYWGTLCIRRFEREVWSNLPRLPATMPAGAGLCARRAVAQRYLELHDAGVRRFQLDRTGGSLMSGGDNDLAACACDLGLGMGLMPELKLQHLIPPQRLTADYIERLVEGIEFSSVVLDASRGLAGPPRSRLGRAVDFLRVARLRAPHNRILAAAYRGRDRAAHFLESSQTQANAVSEPG
jgi:glycosyltransferase involved in cell wall biosynthesis